MGRCSYPFSSEPKNKVHMSYKDNTFPSQTPQNNCPSTTTRGHHFHYAYSYMFRQITCHGPSTASQTELLRAVIDEAWSYCLWEYLQLATLRLRDREYSQTYLRNCLRE